MVNPQQKCRNTAGCAGAQARITGIPASVPIASQLAASGIGTCSHDCEARGARYFAVVTKTSASASVLGRGFSKVNRIFIDDRRRGVSRKSRGTSKPCAITLNYSHAEQRSIELKKWQEPGCCKRPSRRVSHAGQDGPANMPAATFEQENQAWQKLRHMRPASVRGGPFTLIGMSKNAGNF
jgi:hypothetical protein